MLHTTLKELLLASPESRPLLINVCAAEMSFSQCNNIKTAVRNFNYEYKWAFYVEIPKGPLSKENMGCIGHPNVKGQRLMAEGIRDQVQQLLDQHLPKRTQQ
jgi:hypothetical protein